MQKKTIFPLFSGSGGQIKFLIEKKDGEAYWYRGSGPGKDIGSACLLSMGGDSHSKKYPGPLCRSKIIVSQSTPCGYSKLVVKWIALH